MSGPHKVMQTVTHGADSNCMNACLASLFGCGIEETPPLPDNDTWLKIVQAWSRKRGFGHVTISVPNEEVFLESFSSGFLIVAGESARGRRHAVIYKDGSLWHDPHPGSSGIKQVEQVDFFYPLNGPNTGELVG